MLYTRFMQGEEARWETFKGAEQEAQRRAGLRDDASGSRRLRRLSLRRRNLAKDAARAASHLRAAGETVYEIGAIERSSAAEPQAVIA